MMLFVSCSTGDGTAKGQSSLRVKWEVTEGIKMPESAYLDADSGVLFVSNVGGGGGADKDGDGYISKLTLEGKVVTARWVTGLNAPKGLRSRGGTLWVSDIDRLIGIDIAKGEISDTVEIDGAKFLNDVACDGQGAVYVSDTLASKIYRYQDGKVSVFAEGDELESPNGLLVHKDRLIVAAWGLTTDFSTKTPGRLFAVDLADPSKTLITKQPTGNLDGVEAAGENGYVVSDWNAGKVFYVKSDGSTRLLLQLPRGAADLAYLPDHRLLIVPQMLENKVTAYEIPQASD